MEVDKRTTLAEGAETPHPTFAYPPPPSYAGALPPAEQPAQAGAGYGAYPPPPPAALGVSAPGYASPPYLQDWHSGPCSCFDDCGVCCKGFWCPCCLHGDNVAKMDGGGCFMPCCVWYALDFFGLCGIYACGNRRKIRERFGLKGDDTAACCYHTWCPSCAICQDALEIKYRTESGLAAKPTVPPQAQYMQ